MHNVQFWTHNWLILKRNNDQVRRHLNKMTGVVYDLGCGIRPYEKDITAVADRYVGVDWSSTFHGLHADIEADLNKSLPLPDRVADTVVSFQVLEHLCEPQTMLNEAFRILRPGGNIVLTVPFQWGIHEAPHDYFRFTRYGLEYMLGKAGFVDIAVEESSGFWTMWILKANYQSALLVRGPQVLQILVRILLFPFWILGQLVAPILDAVWHSPQETAGYVAVARKR